MFDKALHNDQIFQMCVLRVPLTIKFHVSLFLTKQIEIRTTKLYLVRTTMAG